MTTDEQLRQILNKPAAKATLHWAKVMEVDENNGTMDVMGVADELEYYDVSLGCGSVILVPEKESMCVIAVIEGVDTECVLISAERVKRILVKAETEIAFNGGNLGGMVKVQELTDFINKIITMFNMHTHTVAGVQPGAGTAFVPKPVIQMEKLVRETIENKLIKQ